MLLPEQYNMLKHLTLIVTPNYSKLESLHLNYLLSTIMLKYTLALRVALSGVLLEQGQSGKVSCY